MRTKTFTTYHAGTAIAAGATAVVTKPMGDPHRTFMKDVAIFGITWFFKIYDNIPDIMPDVEIAYSDIPFSTTTWFFNEEQTYPNVILYDGFTGLQIKREREEFSWPYSMPYGRFIYQGIFLENKDTVAAITPSIRVQSVIHYEFTDNPKLKGLI